MKKRTKGRKLIQSKKSKYDGHIFDSQLELYMYKRLKDEGIEFTFNEKSYILIPSFKYKSPVYEPTRVKISGLSDKRSVRAMSYTPDFVGENDKWIIETKGRANESFPLRWKIFKTIMQLQDTPPALFLPRNKQECEETILLIKQWLAIERK